MSAVGEAKFKYPICGGGPCSCDALSQRVSAGIPNSGKLATESFLPCCSAVELQHFSYVVLNRVYCSWIMPPSYPLQLLRAKA